MSTVPCPSCNRPNAPHRGACLYCGHAMPNPQPRGQQTKKQTPKNLDALIRRAMSRGNTAELKKALAEAEEVAVAPPVVHELAEDDPTPLPQVLDELVQKTPAAPSPEALYQDLRAHIEAASGWEDAPRGAEEHLREAQAAIARLLPALDRIEGPPELIFPPFRQAHALFVEPPGTPDDAPLVSEALQLDHPTARMIALAKHPRVARRDGADTHLRALAQAYESRLARPAVVFDEARLRALPIPHTVLSLPKSGPWEIVGGGAWTWDERRGSGRAFDALPIALAVPGEVAVKRFRIRKNKRDETELIPSHEARVGVLDLHHPTGILRVVEGLTTLGGWDLDGLSLRMAFRRFLESDHGDIVVGKRICQPTRKPQELDEQTARATGWPAWEEHTRACRLLYEVGCATSS
ncbi:MAG: hypothetical protein GY913_16805 [Proteobacteria bacterium]|nr:hypothetical protein [Pseudomonadota bacterium]MCP4918564.1 hypothetical protein [Pseudomonadota bacterium]